MSGTRHQGKEGLHLHGLTRSGLPSVQGVTEGRLRTRKPFIHAVVALPSVVAVQMSIARGQSPLICRPVPPAWLPDAGTRGLQARTRGGVGGVKSLAVVNRKPTASLFFCVRRFRGVGVPPRHGSFPDFLTHGSKRARERASDFIFQLLDALVYGPKTAGHDRAALSKRRRCLASSPDHTRAAEQGAWGHPAL